MPPRKKQAPHSLGEEMPAVYINRFSFSVTENLARLSFGEIAIGGSSTEHPRVVVLMSLADAAELASVINRVIEQHEQVQSRKRVN